MYSVKMLDVRTDDNKSSVKNQDVSNNDSIEGKMLATISQIDPKNLKSMSHDRYILLLVDSLTSALAQDYSQLLSFVQAIKDCGKPCYKRDVLIETLHETLIVQDRKVLHKLLCDISQTDCAFFSWKGMANTLVTLPDLVANCDLLKRFQGFVPTNYYRMLVSTLYRSLAETVGKNGCTALKEEIALFHSHLIGRIAIAGFGTLVWNKFTSRLITEKNDKLRNLGSVILRIPIRVAESEIFIEPLYGPIFHQMTASPTNGRLIESIIGTSLLDSETLQHIVCTKNILQTNFNQARHHQNLVLYNIFSYLSRLVSINELATLAATAATSGAHTSTGNLGGDLYTEKQQESSILIETVLEVAKSWSNSTKILLRPYEHNRYIGCALVMALKFALSREHRQCLFNNADRIQSEVIRGLQIYLSRSSSELRNIAMCVAEIVLTSLHGLIDAENGRDSKKRVPLELNVQWDESCLAIKRMFELDMDTFCKELNSKIDSHDDYNSDNDTDENVTRINRQRNLHHHQTKIIEALSDKSVDGKDDDNTDDNYVDDSMDAPIYLNDCIGGLIDNNNPRYVKICLVKVGELIRQLSLKDNDDNRVKNRDVLKKPTTNDAIRDVAIELSQVLLYLEDQYSLDDFDTLQKDALVSLIIAAPDLVAKYLLDELNNQPRNIRLQSIILQTLIESAQQLGNRFTQYGALYFYGITHQLKISTLARSSSSSSSAAAISIVSAVKSMKEDQLIASDDSYLLSRVLLSVSLIIKCLNQHLITCKLSNDLLDILAAYRHHPDSGVRKAIVSCLTVIRDCTPVVYFRENLEDKLAHMFGAWLAIQSEFS